MKPITIYSIKKSFTISMTAFLMMLFLEMCAGQPPKVLTVQVISKDGGQPLSGAVVTIEKDRKNRSNTTIQGGRTTIDPAYEPPFMVKVEYPFDETYLPAKVEIKESDFDSRPQLFKEISLEKKKTSIKGKIIDSITRKSVPIVSVSIDPGIPQMIDSDTSGIFLLQSSNFKNGIIYTINFRRDQSYNDRKYKECSKLIEDVPLFETLDLGIIEMESIEIEKGQIIDETIKPKDQTGVAPTLGL